MLPAYKAGNKPFTKTIKSEKRLTPYPSNTTIPIQQFGIGGVCMKGSIHYQKDRNRWRWFGTTFEPEKTDIYIVIIGQLYALHCFQDERWTGPP